MHGLKNIESWDRDREAYLEQADMESEQAKKYVQKGDEEGTTTKIFPCFFFFFPMVRF